MIAGKLSEMLELASEKKKEVILSLETKKYVVLK
jgi:hypothetical protein